jgi:hypothetical protein
MSLRRAAFAIPGDITTPTGGYIYERRLLEGLRAQGRDVRHLQLGTSFPDPSAKGHGRCDRAASSARARPCGDPRRVHLGDARHRRAGGLHVPSVAMVHHPLALEVGLEPARREHLYRIERANLAHIDHVLVPSPATAAMLTASYDVASGAHHHRAARDRPAARRVRLCHRR